MKQRVGLARIQPWRSQARRLRTERKNAMVWKGFLLAVLAGVWLGGLTPGLEAGDWRITLPRRSEATPVERLNREGVDALRNRQYEKARTCFYKAYLLDPDDPFTLNNLGYISELDGQVERAQRFYALASEQATDAVVERASSAKVEGESFQNAIRGDRDVPMQINRGNFEAIHLLSQGRVVEADALLEQTLRIDPGSPFTLNNLGVTKEMEGDFDAAEQDYRAAAARHSEEPVIVTLDAAARGKAVSEVAATNAKQLRQRLRAARTVASQVAQWNERGVAAVNRNNRREAAADFLKAYQIDPSNAFALNNLGYLAEMDGDLETAQVFYESARSAQKATGRVGLATRQSAEGKKLFEVADQSGQSVDSRLEQQRQARRRLRGPIELKHRDNTPVVEPTQPQTPGSSQDTAH
jgi:Flp pilus assembly protein TadD